MSLRNIFVLVLLAVTFSNVSLEKIDHIGKSSGNMMLVAAAPKLLITPDVSPITTTSTTATVVSPTTQFISSAPSVPLTYAPAVALSQPAVFPAAIQSAHAVSYYDDPVTIANENSIQPISIDVPNSLFLPILNFNFRSASSDLNLVSTHIGAKGSLKETKSDDDPHILKHQVTKPIIQEIKEVIAPYRKITQEIMPLREDVETMVARGVNQMPVPVGVATTATVAPAIGAISVPTQIGNIAKPILLSSTTKAVPAAYASQIVSTYSIPSPSVTLAGKPLMAKQL